MKSKLFSLLIVAVMLFIAVVPASAQLGTTDTSSFTIQNIDTIQVTVTVQFINAAGQVYQPLQVDSLTPTPTPNPFTLDAGFSKQIVVSNIPATQLPAGAYSVVIFSSGVIVAMAGVAGDLPNNTRHFVGSYSGFGSTEGALETYLAVANYNASGWYSMISVQNLGTTDTTATLTLTCSNNSLVGTLTSPPIPEMASYTFVLKNTVPTGFTSTTSCNGSARINASQPVVVVNNQNIPTGGNTISYGGASAGATPLFITNLQTRFSGWSSALNIRKVGAGSTTVTIDYSDGEPDDTCDLSDTTPGCNLYLPTFHPTAGRFSAIVTSSNPAIGLIAVVGSSNGTRSGAVVGVADGAQAVTAPLVTKAFYGWTAAINCQNVSPTPTTLNVAYSGKTPYNTTTVLNQGDSQQILTQNEAILGTTFSGGVTITANAAGAMITCTIGNTNSSTVPGDWTNQYNAFNK
jgi:hypothetical protein